MNNSSYMAVSLLVTVKKLYNYLTFASYMKVLMEFGNFEADPIKII